MSADWLSQLNRDIIACKKCPRLVAYREQIAREKRQCHRFEESLRECRAETEDRRAEGKASVRRFSLTGRSVTR